MKRLTAVLSLLVLLLLLPDSARALQDGSANRWPYEEEKGRYRAKLASDGRVLWNVQWETRVSEGKDDPQVEVKERGEGRPLRYDQPIVWEKRMLFGGGPGLQVQSVQSSGWNRRGELLNEMGVRADPGAGKIFYQDHDIGRKPESSVVPWKSNVLPDEALFYWMRTLPFEKALAGAAASSECLLMLSPNRRFLMKARVEGTETVTTPAGTFPCFRVSLTPQLFGPLKKLAPKMAFWCKTELPHSWVRYEGPVGGPGSPRAVIELVEYEEGDRRE